MGNVLDRNLVQNISNDIELALGDVENKYNVKITRGNASFGISNMSLKLNVSKVGVDGTVMTKEATDFNTYASMHNITSKLGDMISHLGEDYKVIGWKPRSSKYPVLMEKVSNGGRYKFPVALLHKKSNPTAKKAVRTFLK
tara:strand:- start:41 stop:463 length:423 start_codon:yes stop_codon:yes gene_type:complete